jgi:hypothetical protein
VTYKPVVERRDHVLVSDAKFVEGVCFFDGEKKTGLYLALPYAVADAFLEAIPAKGGEGEEEEEEEEEEEAENDDGVEKEETEEHLPLVAGILFADTFCSFHDEGQQRERKRADGLRFCSRIPFVPFMMKANNASSKGQMVRCKNCSSTSKTRKSQFLASKRISCTE